MNRSTGIKENATSPSVKLFLNTKTLGLIKEKDRNDPILGSSGLDKARMISIAFAFYLNGDDGSSSSGSDSDTDEDYDGEYHFIV